MEYISNILFGAMAIIITFGLAVFVHEFGHMIFALIRGVGVESFAIGMGPKITQWKWGGIEFSLRWLPVGGFVKLQGMVAEDEEEAPAEKVEGLIDGKPEAAEAGEEADAKEKSLTEASYDDMAALSGKGLFTKILVFGGGVFMNFVTAILATALLMFIGQEFGRTNFVIEAVEAESAPAQIGFQAGDRVIAADGTPIEFFDEFADRWETQWDEAEGPKALRRVAMDLTVEDAAGEKRQVALPAMTKDELLEFMGGVDLLIPPVVGGVIFHQPADRAGLETDDLVKSIDGQPVNSFREMATLIRAGLGQTLVFEVERDGETLEMEVTPKPGIEDKSVGSIGIGGGSLVKKHDRVANPFVALAKAPGNAIARVAMIIDLNVGFFKKASFQDVRENVGGPIAIAAMTVRAAEDGFVGALNWFILLNLLLMIFNLLPLPVLDGGFIVLAFIEAVIRRPVPTKILGPIYTFFIVVLISLMVLISIQDVRNLLN